MKEGNQFYLEFQIVDENNDFLDIKSVLKVQFTIGELTKIYDGSNEEVIYNETNSSFKIWLTETETFKLNKMVTTEARILFKGDKNTIGGTYIEEIYWHEALTEETLNV